MKKLKYAFFDTKPYDLPAFNKYGEESDIEFKFFETKLNADTAELARGFDGVCVFVNDQLDAAAIDKLTELGVGTVALRCAGFNNVDMQHAFGRVHVLRVPAYSPYAVAEHTMALLLTSIRRIHKAYIRTRDHNFSLNGMTGFDLHGRTVGIIGTGRIGRVFADICFGFGMKVVAYDKYPSDELIKKGATYLPLEELFRVSDVISLHCPLTDDTYHLINSETLELCRRGVVILNTSRGALVDAEALLGAIKSRRVGAACLDVYEEESDFFFEDLSGHIISDDVLARLISMPNVIVTSHQAFLTEDALESIAKTTVANIRSIHDSGRCENELCYRCGEATDCKTGKCF